MFYVKNKKPESYFGEVPKMYINKKYMQFNINMGILSLHFMKTDNGLLEVQNIMNL